MAPRKVSQNIVGNEPGSLLERVLRVLWHPLILERSSNNTRRSSVNNHINTRGLKFLTTALRAIGALPLLPPKMASHSRPRTND